MFPLREIITLLFSLPSATLFTNEYYCIFGYSNLCSKTQLLLFETHTFWVHLFNDQSKDYIDSTLNLCRWHYLVNIRHWKEMQQYVLIAVIFYWLRLYNISLVLTSSGFDAASHEISLCMCGDSMSRRTMIAHDVICNFICKHVT